MYLILLNIFLLNIFSIKTENSIVFFGEHEIEFGHVWDKRNDLVTIYFNVSRSIFNEYRFYYFDFRRFGTYEHREHFSRQRLVDTYNTLNILGLHEDDYVSCVTFIDEYENIYKPRFTCYEFTLGEKVVGSHHGGSTGYLTPLLIAVAFVMQTFIAIVHHIKSKNYAQRLLHRFIDVNPKVGKRMINIENSLRKLDHPRLSASVQRRLSRVAIDANEYDSSKEMANDNLPIYVLPPHNRKMSFSAMKTISEHRV